MYTLIADHPRLLLIDKQPNQSFHRDEAEFGLLDQLRQDFAGELYPVHRLDKLTSGLLLFARDPITAAELGAAFAQRRMEKYYWAISARSPAKKQGWVIGDMDKGRDGSWKLLPSRHDPAVTQFFSAGLGNGLRFFVLKPGTGRTHQLRVALKSLGSPILGDSRYGGAERDRGYLHAYALRFNLGEEAFSFCSPPHQGAHWPEADHPARLRFAEPWQLDWPTRD